MTSKAETINKAAKTLPEVGAATRELTRRQTRAFVSLALRVVGVGILIAVGVTRVPALAANRWVLDVAGMGLIIWPFLTEWGRITAWRIALGKAYAGAGRWAEAEQALTTLSHRHARFFDATGEGRRLLTEAQTKSAKTRATHESGAK